MAPSASNAAQSTCAPAPDARGAAASRRARRARRCDRPSRVRRHAVTAPGSRADRPCGNVDPRGGLRHEVRPRVVGVRAGGAEAADRGDDERRELLAHVVAREPEAGQVARALALDHHVDRAEELQHTGTAGVVGRRRSSARLLVLRWTKRSGCSTFRVARRAPRPSPRRRRGRRRPCRSRSRHGSVASSRTATSLRS